MSFKGAPEPNNGYWNSHEPPNTYGPQETRSPYQQNAPASYPTTPANGAQPYNQATQHSYGMKEYTSNEYYSPSTIQPQAIQPQFITPAQMFQQPPPSATHLNPSSLSRTPSTPSFEASPSMGNSHSDMHQPDKAMLLLALAEEYFEAAHALAPSAVFSMTPTSVDTYEHLIATGLACLDAALKRVKLSPRMEAIVRLRYAGVLYEETENTMEAETALSKGIGLCERNHYFDLKYAMQYLLAQLMAKKNPKAAVKALDGHISEAEAYQHVSWVYALRFLRASYALESSNLADKHLAIQNLQKIAELATRQGDRAIHLMTSVMEAMVHLKSTGPESIEQVQRALAAARAHQFDAGKSIPQLIGLTYIIDVMCSIRQGNPQHILTKLKEMQAALDKIINDPIWNSHHDVIAIPINRTPRSSQTVSHETRAVLGIGEDGRDNLMMTFLNKRDTYAITYLICGIVLLHKNPIDQKAVKYLDTGIEFFTKDTKTTKIKSGLLPDLVEKQEWRGSILCYFRLYLGFSAAARADWVQVRGNIDELKSTAKSFDIPISGPLECLTMYLTGVYYQGVGDLDAALHIYQDKRFNLPTTKNPNATSADQVERDFSLLAALNTLWILQDPHRQNTDNNTAMIARLEPICSKHQNTDIQTAFHLAMATVKTNPPAQLFTIKKYLGAALAGAQATVNTQFLCITLNVMCNKFFSNVVGQQAEKSAQAASIQAERSGNILWRSVADGMLSRCYEVQGKNVDAQTSLENARQFAQVASSQMMRPNV
ncbi:MAU2 chromatid cohesion factor-like protein [Lachnellula occidentalis]|uniref:MAU2 chromatid cohesion factor-like protein n=1 Tax=Lachnellula occidentalis TaxID=215460 RepID=A0A8H8S4W6_9HELO|nr:MAU2 chromatid cohesion factor-like protein [Lachnellula occidentalis]